MEPWTMRTLTAVGAILLSGLAGPAFAAEPAGGVPLTFAGMFLQADIVVKLVIVLLGAASLATWTVLFAKAAELKRMATAWRAVRDTLGQARGLEGLRGNAGVATPLLESALTELRLSSDALHDTDGVKERVATRLGRIEAEAAREAARGIHILATIGATAPFVGLFGTVWGIMNSFVGIAAKQTTSLAVVAPGIAEALLATAVGLTAAIPAVVIYNHFARVAGTHRALVGDVAAAVMNLVSRDLSRGIAAKSAALARVGE